MKNMSDRQYLYSIACLCITITLVFIILLFSIFNYVNDSKDVSLELYQKNNIQKIPDSTITVIETMNSNIEKISQILVENLQSQQETSQQLMAMNIAFLNWAEQQGLLKKEKANE